jgi:hypothetical protein|tara:strand:- start:901 stop:1386 length:486 start_codon:yes stop_codon:yes gene_type:complete
MLQTKTNDLTATDEFRERVMTIEENIRELDGVMVGKETQQVCPVEHRFEHGHYTRVARCQAGVLAVTEIHRFSHPFFFMEGEASILTEDGVHRMKAPYFGITKAGTKRVVYMHTDTVMVTVHQTKESSVDEAEAAIFAKDFSDLEILGSDVAKLLEDECQE